MSGHGSLVALDGDGTSVRRYSGVEFRQLPPGNDQVTQTSRSQQPLVYRTGKELGGKLRDIDRDLAYGLRTVDQDFDAYILSDTGSLHYGQAATIYAGDVADNQQPVVWREIAVELVQECSR
jgi:hypothetical protein